MFALSHACSPNGKPEYAHEMIQEVDAATCLFFVTSIGSHFLIQLDVDVSNRTVGQASPRLAVAKGHRCCLTNMHHHTIKSVRRSLITTTQMRGTAEQVCDACGILTETRTEDVVYELWHGIIVNPEIPLRWRRHPRLLQTMLRRSGIENPDSRRLQLAHRHRRMRLPPPADAPSVITPLSDVWTRGRPLDDYIRRGLHHVAASITEGQDPQQWLQTIDGPALSELLRGLSQKHGWSTTVHDGVRAHLWRLAGLHNPRFVTHSHAVPVAFLENHPALWDMPVCVAVFLWRLSDPDDVDHMQIFFTDVVRRRLVRLPAHRDVQRSMTSVCNRALWVLRLLRDGWAHDPSATWRDAILPFGQWDSLSICLRAPWTARDCRNEWRGRLAHFIVVPDRRRRDASSAAFSTVAYTPVSLPSMPPWIPWR